MLPVVGCGGGETVTRNTGQSAETSTAITPEGSSEQTDNPTVSPPFISWLTDWDEALKKAQAENKIIMIYFHYDACPPCEQFETDVIANEELSVFLGNSFITVKSDTTVSNLYEAFPRVKGVPSVVFTTPGGDELHTILGIIHDDELRTADDFHQESQLVFTLWKEQGSPKQMDNPFELETTITPTPDELTPTPDELTPTPDELTPTPDEVTPTPDELTPYVPSSPESSCPFPDLAPIWEDVVYITDFEGGEYEDMHILRGPQSVELNVMNYSGYWVYAIDECNLLCGEGYSTSLNKGWTIVGFHDEGIAVGDAISSCEEVIVLVFSFEGRFDGTNKAFVHNTSQVSDLSEIDDSKRYYITMPTQWSERDSLPIKGTTYYITNGPCDNFVWEPE